MNRKVDHKIILAKKKLRKLSKNYKQNFKPHKEFIISFISFKFCSLSGPTNFFKTTV